MALTYIQAIGIGYPGVQCHTTPGADGSVYSNIVWDGGVAMPSQATLDAWISSNSTTAISLFGGAVSGTVPATTGTSLIANSTAVPANTVGSQLWTSTVIPSALTSKLIVDFAIMVASGTAGRTITALLFRGTTCIGASSIYCATASQAYMLPMHYVDSPNTVGSTTYSVRIGISAAATWYASQATTNITFGGATNSTWSIMEI